MKKYMISLLSLEPPSCMVALNRNTGNITFYTLTFQTIAKNMASELDINMANRFHVNNIIFGNNSGGK